MVSLAVQEDCMVDYAQRQGFTIAGVTSEHGSGLDFSRQGIKAVSGAVEASKVDVLLIKDISRLGRDTEEVEVYLRWLKKRNVEVMCADGTVPQLYVDALCGLMKDLKETRVRPGNLERESFV